MQREGGICFWSPFYITGSHICIVHDVGEKRNIMKKGNMKGRVRGLFLFDISLGYP